MGGGAILPAVLPIDFRTGILILAGFYLLLAAVTTCGGAQVPTPPVAGTV